METWDYHDNHSIAYCMLGYICAYLRRYYPIEFITSFLNNAANDDDIAGGTKLAKLYGFNVISPRWGFARSNYFFDGESKTISKGVSSIKSIGESAGNELYELAHSREFDSFVDLLLAIKETSVNSGQLGVLIQLDYFEKFGNQRELLWIVDMFNYFKRGEAKQISREAVEGSPFEQAIVRNSNDRTKKGDLAKKYTLLNTPQIMRECEEVIRSRNLPDLDDITKVKNFVSSMGYAGYTSGKPEDRPKLYIRDIYPVKRKKDGVQFGYNILTQSIGSGIESRFTVYNKEFDKAPIHKGDIIYCQRFERDRQYFDLRAYYHIYNTADDIITADT